ncbi:MAG: CsbD family protein [Pseudomonadota bacterium]
MNWEQIEGNWKQLKGNIKQQWGKLTDDELDVIAGKREQLAGKIQTAYGISKQEAHQQVSDWETMLTNIPKSDQRVTHDSGAKPLPPDSD